MKEIKDSIPPEWIHIIPKGQFAGRDGRQFQLADPEEFIKRTKDYQAGVDIIIDYEHQTDRSEENGQPAPAAGWIRGLESRSDGIWAKVEWTPKAESMIRSKEYRYLSPAYFQDKTGNLIRLDSVALVGQPNLELKAMNKALKLNSLQKQGAVRMDFLAQLATILGLAEGATEEAVISAVKALTETAAAEPAVNSTEEDGTGSAGAASADALPEAEAELLQAVETLVAVADETAGASSNKIKNAAEKAKKYLVRTSSGGQMDKATANAIHELAQKVNSLQAEVDQEKALKVVNHAVSQGKVSPSLRKWAMDYATANFAGFTDYIKNAPVLVKNSQGQEFVKSSSNAMTDTELQVCRQLGITQEQFNKSKADSPAKN